MGRGSRTRMAGRSTCWTSQPGLPRGSPKAARPSGSTTTRWWSDQAASAVADEGDVEWHTNGSSADLHRYPTAACVIVLVGLLTGACTSSTQGGSNPTSTASPREVNYASPNAPPGFDRPMRQVRSGRLDAGTYAFLDVGGAGFNVRLHRPRRLELEWSVSEQGRSRFRGWRRYLLLRRVRARLCRSLSLGRGAVESAHWPRGHRSHGRPVRPVDEERGNAGRAPSQLARCHQAFGPVWRST